MHKFVLRMAAALPLLAAAVVAALQARPESSVPARALLVGLAAALFFAALGNLIGGWRAALTGVVWGAALVAGVSGRELFGEKYGALIGMALAAGLLFLSTNPLLPRRPRRARRGAQTPAPAAPDSAALLDALARRPDSSLIARSAGGIAYQLLRDRDRLYAVRLGPAAGPDQSKLIASGARFRPEPGSFSIEVAKLREVRVSRGSAGRPSLRLRADGLTRRLTCLEPAGERALRRMFDGAPLTVERRRASKPSARRFVARKASAYRSASIALAVPGGLCAAVFALTECPYRPFEALNLLFAVAATALYCAYFRETEAMDKEARAEAAMLSWGPPVTALALRGLLDFDLDHPAQLLPPSAAIALAAVAAFFTITRGARPPLKRALAALSCAALLFAPAAAVHLNHLLDAGANRVERPAVVESLREERGSRGSIRYLVTVGGENPRKQRVAKSVYEQLAPGDAVRVITTVGALGIAYTDIAPGPADA